MKNILIVFACFLSISVFCQAPQWQWATSFPGSLRTQSATDDLGNTFITGTFSGNLDIGDSSFASRGSSDVFIAKFNSAGQFVWANHAGGATDDASRAIAIDKTGNCYITGKYTDTAYFDSQKLVSLDSQVNQNRIYAGDIFIAKYNSAGELSWVKSAGGVFADIAYGIALDQLGGVYVCGGFTGYEVVNVIYGDAQFDTISIKALGTGNTFLAKYDTAGNAVWARAGGGRFFSYASAVSCTLNGDVAVAGSFDYPSIQLNNIQLNSVVTAGANVFVAEYNSTGAILWAKAAGGESGGDIGVGGIAADSAGNIFITGTAGCINNHFDNYILHNDLSGPNTARSMAYLAKYNANGIVEWAKNICSNTIDYTRGSSVIADKVGSAYVSGNYGGYCSVKPGDTLRSYGNYDAYVAKFDAAGNGVWATHAGGSGAESANAIGMDGQGGLYVSGSTSSATATFGDRTLSGSGQDIFIAKLAGTTGIAGLAGGEDGVSVFPNPNAGEFIIKYPAGDFDQLQLADIRGQVVYQQGLQTEKREILIHLSSITPGFYLLRLSGVHAQVSRKLFVHK